MLKDLENRIYLESNYILKNKCTIRSMVNVFNVSKSTIHYDLSIRLKKINFTMYKKVNKILKYNFSQRHIRGGLATQKKYKNKRCLSR